MLNDPTLVRLETAASLALGWLTRIPVQMGRGTAGTSLGNAVWAFPLVGVVVAAAGATGFVVAHCLGAGAVIAAVVAVAAMAGLTGILHEDGFGDFFDGLAARGGRDGRLAAMRDSRLGAAGAVALILLVIARVAALSEFGAADAIWVLLAACATGRAAMGVVMLALPPARPDGSGHAAGIPAPGTVGSALAIAAVIAIPAMLFGPAGILDVVLVLLLAAAVVAWIARSASRAFGGFTGDVLGACCIGAETAVLVALSMLPG
ncbi:MAG: adenosylcobinamide-GDP ribazoletransferase [Pseudomonadota bacterium]|nr:adenosylcobinamide-GDP ribazoletransferase [Pseudomonadota bacterium]